MNKPKLLPDIFEYLETLDNKHSISVKDLEDVILNIRAFTGLSREASELVLKHSFQEIRNAMLRGDIVTIRNFGNFFVASPRNATSKRKIFPKFKSSPTLNDKVNYRSKSGN